MNELETLMTVVLELIALTCAYKCGYSVGLRKGYEFAIKIKKEGAEDGK